MLCVVLLLGIRHTNVSYAYGNTQKESLHHRPETACFAAGERGCGLYQITIYIVGISPGGTLSTNSSHTTVG